MAAFTNDQCKMNSLFGFVHSESLSTFASPSTNDLLVEQSDVKCELFRENFTYFNNLLSLLSFN